MRAFIEKVFKMKKLKEELVQDKATEAAVEAIVETKSKSSKHNINECGCHECELARDQGAK